MTKRIPWLTEKAVQVFATPQSFAKGMKYYRSGAVSDLVRRGETVSSEVEGSAEYPYNVAISFREGGVEKARCDCEYDWEGPCKHVVATLLKLLHEPQDVTERQPIEDVLKDLDRRALLQLILKRTESDRALATWIEVELGLAEPNDENDYEDEQASSVISSG